MDIGRENAHEYDEKEEKCKQKTWKEKHSETQGEKIVD